MKKFLAILLSVLMMIMVLPLGLAEESDSSFTTLDLVKKLKSNSSLDDIWVPIFSQGFEIQDFSQSSQGSYCFSVNAFPTSFRINVFSNQKGKRNQNALSPYHVYQSENEFPAENFNLLENIFTNEIAAYNQGYYVYTGTHFIGRYGEFPAASMVWAKAKKYDPNSRPNFDDNVVGGEHYLEAIDTIQETLIALTPNITATVVHPLLDDQKDVFAQFKENYDIRFTTYGDADGNTAVNAKDALAILKHAVQKVLITDELALLLADCNNDGTINATDALFTLRKAVRK